MTDRPRTKDEVGAEWAALLCLLPGYDPFRAPGDSWFDAAAALRAVEFIHSCIRHVEGGLAGEPFILESWQRAFVCNLFGWKRKDVKGRTVRRYRKALLYVARKNGKTPFIAAISLYVFFCDGEAGMQGEIAAADRGQAGMLFRQAQGMIEREPELAGRCRIYGGNASAGQSKSIVRESDASYLRVISADADTKHGGNLHLVVVGELHAQPSRDLVDVLCTGTASLNRKQPLIIFLTTADYDRPSICNEEHKYAGEVRDGVRDDPAYLPAIYELSREDDWRDRSLWRKANPNLGVSVSEEYLEAEAKRAEGNPSYENTFRRLHLNQMTEQDERVIDLGRWDACPTFDAAALDGMECWGGLDIASTTDLAAFVLLFRIVVDDVKLKFALPFFWAPMAKARERGKADRVDYLAWAKAGFLKLTDGELIDHDVIRADIGDLAARYQIRKIGADRWNATQLITQLRGDGMDVVGFGQGYSSMNGPTKGVLDLVTESKIVHNGNPVLRWCAGNLAAERDSADNVKPSKSKSTDRIDGMVSLIMAHGLEMAEPESSGGGLEVWS